MIKGKIHILPTFISENNLASIPHATIEAIHKIKYFVVERARTARRYISLTKPPYKIEELSMVEINAKQLSHIETVLNWIHSGKNVGLISESGIPSVADPGSDIISIAHQKGISVIPHTGPSSIITALSASGFNGQNFCFRGYLPIKDNELSQEIKKLETIVNRKDQTQIFIETPYRNDRMFKILISSLNKECKLCVAKDITGKNEFIKTKAIKDWVKLSSFSIGKYPCIFLIGK